MIMLPDAVGRRTECPYASPCRRYQRLSSEPMGEMGDLLPIWSFGQEFPEPLTVTQQKTLERAVAKMVLLGARVGVSAEQMIGLLNSGLTVSELLEYLAVRYDEIR